MASKKKATHAATGPTELQKSVILASQAQGFTYISRDNANALLADGYVQINDSMVDGAGNVAVRPTDKLTALVGSVIAEAGVVAAITTAASVESKPVTNSIMKYSIEDNVALPAVKRIGLKESIYPFNDMNVGQSFFIPATAEHPEPARTLASTVASATRRNAVVDPEGKTRINKKGNVVPVLVPTKVFTIRAVEGGARVWRTK
jgi:hypothetical protein